MTAEVTSFVVGPAIGGLMLAPAARPFVPVLSAVLVLAAVAVFRGVEMPAPTRSGAPGSALGVARTMARSRPLVHALAAVCTVSLVCSAAALVLLPLAEEVWGRGETGFGIATAAFGFGGLAGPLMAPPGAGRRRQRGLDRRLRRRARCVLVALSPGLAWALLPLALVGAAAVQVEAMATATFQRATPDRHRASVLGIGRHRHRGGRPAGLAGRPGRRVDPRARRTDRCCSGCSLPSWSLDARRMTVAEPSTGVRLGQPSARTAPPGPELGSTRRIGRPWSHRRSPLSSLC